MTQAKIFEPGIGNNANDALPFEEKKSGNGIVVDSIIGAIKKTKFPERIVVDFQHGIGKMIPKNEMITGYMAYVAGQYRGWYEKERTGFLDDENRWYSLYFCLCLLAFQGMKPGGVNAEKILGNAYKSAVSESEKRRIEKIIDTRNDKNRGVIKQILPYLREHQKNGGSVNISCLMHDLFYWDSKEKEKRDEVDEDSSSPVRRPGKGKKIRENWGREILHMSGKM